MATYLAGSLVQVKGTFTDNATNDLLDPPVVTLYWKDGAGTTTTKVYGDDANFITRQAEGTYTANLDTTPTDPTNVGIWIYQWQGAGDDENPGLGQAVNAGQFVVEATPIPLS